ncbi:MAG: MMPL family transporter [Solirubrobacterales bacterium]|nr:MMPL family transporter [Solirubrobacterales bacterium]
MTPYLYKLGHFCTRHRWWVLGFWLVVAVATVAVSQRMGDNLSDNLSLPGTGSDHATNLLQKPFPAQANGTSPIILHAKSGKLTDSKYQNAVNAAASDLKKNQYVTSVINPLTPQGASALSKDKSTGYLTVGLKVNPGSLSQSQAQSIINAAANPAQAAGLEAQTGGQLGLKVSKPSTESSELIGIIAALFILAFVFGTITAMVLPILTAIFGLAITLSIIRMLGHALTVPTVSPTLATMIGLGVGIDYALFIVTRHIRGLQDGLDMNESISRSVATSGGAVFFAGSTVTIALVSLAVAGIPLVTTMGLMAAISVVVAVSAALTLLPAFLAILGRHINSLRIHHPPTATEAKKGVWAKYANDIAKQPIVAGLAALAILIPLSIPLFSLTLGQQDVAAFSTSTTVRQAYDLTAKYFGPGVTGPLLIAVKLGSPAQPASSSSSGSGSSSSSSSSSGGSSGSGSSGSSQSDPRATDPRLTTLQGNVSKTSGVASVSPIAIDKAGTTAYFSAISKYNPASTKTTDIVTSLRSTAIPNAEKGTNMKAHVGGTTAAYEDLASRISSKLPLQILVVIALSFCLLILAFRTAVVPAQAAVMNLLSIGASYGVLTAIFQFGWLSGLVGLSGSVPIVSYVPLFMFAILFGLSMDYEVFLVSQIEEHVHEGEDNRTSVTSGLVTSARVITAAALIMVFVFGSFLTNGNPTVKQFGVGLAVAVILDATVVRCLLVPALMIMMGKVNWWMPRWLDRLVPQFSIEGAEYFAERDKKAAAAPEPVPVSAGPDHG